MLNHRGFPFVLDLRAGSLCFYILLSAEYPTILHPTFCIWAISYCFYIPGHPWDEKGLQRQEGVGVLVRIPGMNSASRPAGKPRINRGGTGGEPVVNRG